MTGSMFALGLVWCLLSPIPERPGGMREGLLSYDAGREDERDFRSALLCGPEPCVVTQTGIVRFHLPEDEPYTIDIHLLQEGRTTRVDYFEKRSLRDYFLFERMFNLKRNKLVWSMSERLSRREIDELHVYGVELHYELEEGDLIAIEIAPASDPSTVYRYLFRYHQDGYYAGFDLALLVPINALQISNSDESLDVGALNVAATVSLKRHKDPERRYSLIESIAFAGDPTLFVGVLSRELDVTGTSLIALVDQVDMFMGGGFSFLDFIFVGLGANILHKPRIVTPFIGFQVKKGLDFIYDLDRTSPSKWDSYIERERERGARH